MRFFMPAILLALLAGCATSSNPSLHQPLPDVVSVPEYTEFLDKLDTAVDEGIPRELNKEERAEYNKIDRQLRTSLAGHQTIETMNHEEKIELYNLHEALQAVVVGEQENQVICRKQRTVGTHFKETTCKTRREFEQEQQASRRFLDDQFKSFMTDPMSGG